MDLDRVTTITSKQRAHLKKAGFTTTYEVLCCPTSALHRRSGLSSDEVESCVQGISSFRMPACFTVAELLRAKRAPKLSVGAGEAYDELLGGGLRTGVLTEVVGESAAGKSNLCMQLAIQAQLPVELGGLAASALYLTSETSQSAFPSPRLLELARATRKRWEGRDDVPSEANLMANVHLGNASSLDALDLILSHHAPRLADELQSKQKPRLGLIIVDSLAAPSRADFATNTLSGLNDRAKALCLIGDALKRLAHDLQLVAVVVNQVSDVFFDPSPVFRTEPSSENGLVIPRQGVEDELELTYDAQARFFSGQAPDLPKQAALGLVWANGVDVRIMLSLTRRRMTGDEKGEKESVKRATSVFSPFAPPGSVDYVIREEGILVVSGVYGVGERWPLKSGRRVEVVEASEDELWAPLNSEAEYEVQVP